MTHSTATPTVRKNSSRTVVRVDSALGQRSAGDLARRAIAGVKLRSTHRLPDGRTRRVYRAPAGV